MQTGAAVASHRLFARDAQAVKDRPGHRAHDETGNRRLDKHSQPQGRRQQLDAAARLEPRGPAYPFQQPGHASTPLQQEQERTHEESKQQHAHLSRIREHRDEIVDRRRRAAKRVAGHNNPADPDPGQERGSRPPTGHCQPDREQGRGEREPSERLKVHWGLMVTGLFPATGHQRDRGGTG
jgi:hypothetical protein